MDKIGTDSHFSHPAKANSSLKKKKKGRVEVTMNYKINI